MFKSLGPILGASILVTAALPVLAESPGDAFTASRLVELLETGQIAEGMNDTAFRNEGSGLQHTESGRYSAFYLAGMDVTDSVSIISKDGVLIYANLNSCSDSKTYFRSTAEYFRYLHSAN